jgi:hypothetical protein
MVTVASVADHHLRPSTSNQSRPATIATGRTRVTVIQVTEPYSA